MIQLMAVPCIFAIIEVAIEVTKCNILHNIAGYSSMRDNWLISKTTTKVTVKLYGSIELGFTAACFVFTILDSCNEITRQSGF